MLKIGSARESMGCHLRPTRRMIVVALLSAVLVLVAGPSMTLSSDLSEEAQARLEEIVGREGALVFLALYWLPESHEWFLAAVGRDPWWQTGTLQDFEDMLSRHQKREGLNAVADRLGRLTADERESYFQRLGRWLTSYRQLELMERFVSVDLVAEAMVSLPATRPVYDSIVSSRGFDSSQATPQMIAETMASGELTDTWHKCITVMSSFGDAELMVYFRDLYSKLAELGAPEGYGK